MWFPVVWNPYSDMKITIELPEDLFLRAKRQVLEKGTTLKALMETGLRHILTQSNARSDKPYRISVINHMASLLLAKVI